MNKKYFFDKPVPTSILYLFASILNMSFIGWTFRIKQLNPYINHLGILLSYLAISEFWILLEKLMYHKNKQFTWKIYYLKLFLSFSFILVICLFSNFKIALLLLIYELYQLFLFRNSSKYLSSLFYPIMTAILKGFLFNYLFALSKPFSINLLFLQTLIIPISLFLVVGRIEQQIFKNNKQELFTPTFIIYELLLIISGIYSVSTNQINLLQLLAILIINFSYFYLLKLNHLKALQQATLLQILTTLIIFTITL